MGIVSSLDNERASILVDHDTGNAHRVTRVLAGHLVTPISQAGTVETTSRGDGMNPAARPFILEPGLPPEALTVLSAWESVPSGLLCSLTCGAGYPRVTVGDRSLPG